MQPWHKAWLLCLYFMKHDNSTEEMEQYFCNMVHVIEKANFVFQILFAGRKIIPFFLIALPNLLCRCSMEELHYSLEQSRQRKVKGELIKELKHENQIISE